VLPGPLTETWTLQKLDKKYLERFEMWYWRKMEIRRTDCVRNEVLNRGKEERYILKTRRKAIWIGHILLRNCLPKHIIEGKV
jgi:hypothetical protein